MTKAEKLTAVVVGFAILAVLPAGWIIGSYLEASAFNRLTGKSATTWDAMWVELRVMGD